jgi:cob(I)alamin adenosyltransferase
MAFAVMGFGASLPAHMSIATRTGDDGTTGLMYNRRLPKHHVRVEAYGTVDELNAALGMARATTTAESVRAQLLATQKDLVILMGELATHGDDQERYRNDGFENVTDEMTRRLDQAVLAIESAGVSFKGWATPGATINAAALDVARTVCRRAERRVIALYEAEKGGNPEVVVYLNRLADFLWLLARQVETEQAGTDT